MSNLLHSILFAIQSLLKPVTDLLLGLHSLVARPAAWFRQRATTIAPKPSPDPKKQAENIQESRQRDTLHFILSRAIMGNTLAFGEKASRGIKWFGIFLLEAISLPTTYAGAYMVLSGINTWAPLCFTLFVQGLLFFLSGTSFGIQAGGRKRSLLAIILLISVLFSYIGLSNTVLSYSDHLKGEYQSYQEIHEKVRQSAVTLSSATSNPQAAIQDAFHIMENNLQSWEKLSQQQLESLRQQREYWEKKASHRYFVNSENGQRSGVETDSVAADRIKAIDDQVNALGEVQVQIEEFRTSLSNLPIDMVWAGYENKDSDIEFQFSALQEQSNALVNSLKSNLAAETHIDFNTLRQSEQLHKQAIDSLVIQDFEQLYQNWAAQKVDIPLAGTPLGRLLPSSGIPSELLRTVRQEVEAKYHALQMAAMSTPDLQAELDELGEAYRQFQPIHPLVVPFTYLVPNFGRDFLIAVLLALFALFNDSLAVWVGYALERRNLLPLHIRSTREVRTYEFLSLLQGELELLSQRPMNDATHTPYSGATLYAQLDYFLNLFTCEVRGAKLGFSLISTNIATLCQEFPGLVSLLMEFDYLKGLTQTQYLLMTEGTLPEDISKMEDGPVHAYALRSSINRTFRIVLRETAELPAVYSLQGV